MPADPRIAALPAVRAEAERLAAELWDAVPDDGSDPQEGIGLSTVERGMLALLADLTRPASLDAVVRLVAGALGMVCGNAAPGFVKRDGCHDDWGGAAWCIESEWSVPAYRWFSSCAPGNGTAGRSAAWRGLPGISAIDDPAEALTLIALAVLGGPDAR